MSRPVHAYAAVIGAAALSLVAVPYAAADGGGGSSGGTGLSSSPTPPSSNQPALGLASSSRFIGGKIGVVSPGNVTVSATASGIAINVTASTMLGNQLRITGHVPSADAGQTIEIERLGHETQWAWSPTARAKIRADGSFSASWTTDHIGRFEIGLTVGGASAGPVVMVTVFRSSFATWFGPIPGANHTACGELLTHKTLGVANRTLPCGTRVAIYFNSHTIVVPVIDRGPYANHADWDLTEGTARQLGFLAVGAKWIGAVSLPRKP
ncbi:MAG: septal ring lytic transglycosylase RlpA family protein [Actinomycetota bacterium]|nr:septal ring lytic transglycosylase RlpA family protein [Actinomycetota bacterium]